MADCEKYQKLMQQALNGELLDDTELKAHVQTCAQCKREWDALRMISDTLRTLPAVEPPETFAQELHEKLAAASEPIPKVPIYKRWRLYSSLAAVVLLAVVLKTGLLEREFSPTPTQTSAPRVDSQISAPVAPSIEEKAEDTAPSEKPKASPQATEERKPEQKTKPQEPVQQTVEEQVLPKEATSDAPVLYSVQTQDDTVTEPTPQAAVKNEPAMQKKEAAADAAPITGSQKRAAVESEENDTDSVTAAAMAKSVPSAAAAGGAKAPLQITVFVDDSVYAQLSGQLTGVMTKAQIDTALSGISYECATALQDGQLYEVYLAIK